MRSLREDDAWPADPEEGQGLQKLYMEKLCQYYTEGFGLDTRIARFHDVYGALARYDGGRETAPAAICRKIALANDGAAIDLWADGKQKRSFLHVDDCVEGLHRLMCSDCPIPVNLDTCQTVTLDQLAGLVAQIAGKAIRVRHNLSMPQGARACNSDSALARHVLEWEPRVSLSEGLARTYAWIAHQLGQRGAGTDGHVARPSTPGCVGEPIISAA